MKIYTKGGDAGETSLYGGHRVPKDDLRIRAYGALDELNAVLGMVLAEMGQNNGNVKAGSKAPTASADKTKNLHASFVRLQNELFQLGAELATPRGKKVTTQLIEDSHVQALEKEIDAMEDELQPLKTFILPGGSQAAALVHFARTVSRRAERELITLNRAEPVRPAVLQYFNRLSDYLFVASRYLNHCLGVADVPWVSKKS